MASQDISTSEPKAAVWAAIEQTALPDGAKSIMQAAACLFAKKGYGPTTVRNIAGAADVTVPMVYYYFDGKEQLFTRLFESIGMYMHTRLHQASAEPGQTFRDELVAITRVFRGLLHPCPVALQLVTQFVFGPREGGPRLDHQRVQKKLVGHFQELFETAVAQQRLVPTEGHAPAHLAVFFINTMRSHVMWVMKQMEHTNADREALYQEYLTDEALERLVDVFLRGAGQAD